MKPLHPAPMLTLARVDAGYGSFQALFNVSLEMAIGEAAAVIGPNGAGKTTLMRVISGLIRATAGALRLQGTDLGATPAYRIPALGIAHVPENRRLFARMTVEDDLRMGAYVPSARRKFRQRLSFVYELFPRLAERRLQLAGTMSGGEQQMCAIGRALMSEPRLLLLDEPSAGLAPVIVQLVFELVRRIRDGGLTVLIVEQNLRQVLRVVDRAYLLEALINGLLLGGVLALLALALNQVFGVIDVIRICYVELVMLGMYAMYFLYSALHLPFLLSALICIGGVGALGGLLHVLVIAPLLGAVPINQLLATGGVLFFLQSVATVAFGIDFRNLGIRLPVLELSGMYISYARLLACGVALGGMVALYLLLSRTFTGTAIRAIAQDRRIMPLMGVDARRIYLITSLIGGALAGLAACLLVLQYDIHPFVGLTFGPITFMTCVLGGLGDMVGGFIAAFVFAEIISVSGLYLDLEWGYVFAFGFFVVMMFVRPRGLIARRS